MHMRINSAGEDKLAGRINHFYGSHIQCGLDADDLFILNQDIRLKCAGGSDQSSIFNECAHRASGSSETSSEYGLCNSLIPNNAISTSGGISAAGRSTL